ncbi:MAG: hypothetical protein ABIW76_02115 [Fibrobacteria bacterium]
MEYSLGHETRKSRNVAWAVLLGASAFLGACVSSNEDSGAYVDPAFKDTPIDARVAGRTLSGSFDQGKEWNTTLTAPNGLQALGGVSTSVGVLKKQASMAGNADLGVEFKVNLDDTGKGFATVYSETQGILVYTKDTAIVKWDDNARDTVKDNERIISFKRVAAYTSGKIETAEFTDGDGDNIVTAAPGNDNKVKLVLTVEDKGAVEKTTLLVGAGADANFDKEEDNTILKAEWVKTKGGVVTGTGAYLDADGDGIVTDNSKTCLVIAKYSEIEPKDRPLIAKADFEAKVRILANKAGDEPVTFSYSETTKLKRTNKVSIKNRAGGSEIVKGDTMTVLLETTVGDADDTLKHAFVEFVMNPGQDLKSDADDVCYAIHIKSSKRFGFEREAEFNFVSDEPIPHGAEPVSGTFDGSATYANGRTATLSGSFSPAGFSGKYTGPEGNTVSVVYSKNGDVVSNP